MSRMEINIKTKDLLFSKKYWETRQTARSANVLGVSCIFFAVISLCLTVLNIVKGYWFMTAATSILTLGMLVAFLFCRHGKLFLSSVLLSALIAFLFSVFAVTGENEGFAILWILLVPIVTMNLLSLEFGVLLSLYFQIFLIVIFYTPLSAAVGNGNFSQTFIMRFPLLYLCSFGGTFILAVNREKNYVIRTMQSYTDGLTGLYNRAKFMSDLENTAVGGDVTVCSFDLNGLKLANDTYGHEAGDRLIVNAAEVLSRTWGRSGRVFRLGGDEFTVVVRADSGKIEKDLELYRKNLEEINAANDVKVSFSVGVASSDAEGTSDINRLGIIADQRMYKDKEVYYSDRQHERRKGI